MNYTQAQIDRANASPEATFLRRPNWELPSASVTVYT